MVAPVAQVQTRRYRVLNLTVTSADEAERVRRLFEGNTTQADLERLASRINGLLEAQKNTVSVVLTYDGASVTPDTEIDLSDWHALNPGGRIYFAAAGAAGETDAALQLGRLSMLEHTVGGHTEATRELAIVPYPDAAVPADADGLMLLITVPIEKKALVVIGGGHSTAPMHIVEVPYADDVPQQDAVAALLKKYGSVAGLKKMTVMPTSSQTAEADAKKRAAMLAQAMKLKGDVTKEAGTLSEADIKALADRGKNVTDYAEVIRIE